MFNQASVYRYILNFKEPAGTSRGTLLQRSTWYILLEDKKGNIGVGECAPLPLLSIDYPDQDNLSVEQYEQIILDCIKQAKALLQKYQQEQQLLYKQDDSSILTLLQNITVNIEINSKSILCSSFDSTLECADSVNLSRSTKSTTSTKNHCDKSLHGLNSVQLCNYQKSNTLDSSNNIEENCTQVKSIEELHHIKTSIRNFPSILFGLECAVLDLLHQQQAKSFNLFDSSFVKGESFITINGLIWMGNYEEMLKRIEQKLSSSFSCVKLKIGGIQFDDELALLKKIRDRFSSLDLELRVDANGAFKPIEVFHKLDQLAQFDLHSIEQPIKQGQVKELAKVCKNSPIPIALDEELIMHTNKEAKEQLIAEVQPHYLVIKPSLHGGIVGTYEWIELAMQYCQETKTSSKVKLANTDIATNFNNNLKHTPFWLTSALESNIGLQAIAEFCAKLAQQYNSNCSQGLGTGQLFTNNLETPLFLDGERMYIDCNKLSLKHKVKNFFDQHNAQCVKRWSC